MNWMQQLNTTPGECHRCGKDLAPGVIYFRAAVNPDSEDAEGYDVCAGCRKQLTADPPPK